MHWAPTSSLPAPSLCRWALAELNVTLSAFQHEFQEQTLLDSVCFTKSSKAEAFEKVGAWLCTAGCMAGE